MFDYRYHALSLAAVLLALALGVLLGIAIGDSSLVSSAKSGIVHKLNSELQQARRETGQAQQHVSSERAFADALYPLAVHELLAGRTIGLVFLGGSSDAVNSLVRGAVAQAGGTVTTVLAVREPLEVEGIARAAAGTHYAALGQSAALVQSFGELVGRQLVSGGAAVSRELIGRASGALFSAFDGQLTRL
ncbi:MAG TPA: copper transporter, partial [Solirubrobacteraceae bacterium]|nr:copper transporter [Solirubrobacteraceae bacterium]